MSATVICTLVLAHVRVHNDGAGSEATAVLYEALPFPPLHSDFDTCDECPGSFLRKVASTVWNGRMRRDISVLDAGTGSGPDCLSMTRELQMLQHAGVVDNFHLVCMDISAASLELARRRLARHGITSEGMPTLLHGSFEDASLLHAHGPFDYIHAEGSIHHNNDPPAALRSLAASLRDRWSAMRAMVYSEVGSRAITDVARAFRLLQDARGLRTTAERLQPAEIGRLRDYITTLPGRSWYALTQTSAAERARTLNMSDAGLADLFLHPTEHQFTAADVRRMAHASGLSLMRWYGAGVRSFECRLRSVDGEETLASEAAAAAVEAVRVTADELMSDEQREDFMELHFGMPSAELTFLLAWTQTPEAEATRAEVAARARWSEREALRTSASAFGDLTPLLGGNLHMCAMQRFTQRLWARVALPDDAPPEACTGAALARVASDATVFALWSDEWPSVEMHWEMEARVASGTSTDDPATMGGWPLWILDLTLAELCIATRIDGVATWSQIYVALSEGHPPSAAPAHALATWESFSTAAVQMALMTICECNLVLNDYNTHPGVPVRHGDRGDGEQEDQGEQKEHGEQGKQGGQGDHTLRR